MNTPSSNIEQGNNLRPALDNPLAITFFANRYAQQSEEEEATLRQLAKRVSSGEFCASSKSAMAHIKLGRFSGERTEKNALRSNAAHIAISGIEVDYDAGLMSLDETEKLLRKVNVAAFLYTSPSHDPLNRKHRWRALCPCSKELSPSGRAQLVARLNGALGGVLANESFTASQSFTFGYVFGKTTPDVRLIDGRFVDQCDDLDANAIGKREKNLSEPMAAVDLSNDTGRVKAAAAMLRQSAKRLAATIQGENRNGALAREAFLLGGLIANNLVQPDDVFDAFLPALESNGYLAAYGGEKDATRIITTQLKHGALRPVDPLPDLSHMLTLEDVPEATTTGPKKSSMIDPDDWDDLIGLAPPPGIVAPDWGSPITLGNGQLVNNLSNTIHILGRHIDSIVPGLRFNKLNHEMEWEGGKVDDATLSLAQVGIETAGLNKATKQNVTDALGVVARRFAYHPILDYLNGLEWDGGPRIDDWLIRTVGTSDTPYARAVGRKMLIAMVARMIEPGCKFDHMVVFHGAQDQGKSTLGEILAGEGYFSDTLPSIHNKEEAMRHLVGLWLVEMAELAPSRKTDQEDQKAFLSGKIDRVRFPWSKFYTNVPRTCIFIGTSNDDEFLRDPTGGRRFWPIKVPGLIDIPQLRTERDQLFAEAVAAFKGGEPWWMDREFEVAHARPVQDVAREIDPWVEKIQRYVDDDRVDRCVIRMGEVFSDALELKPVNQTMANSKRVGVILKSMGFEKIHTRSGKVWMRGANELL